MHLPYEATGFSEEVQEARQNRTRRGDTQSRRIYTPHVRDIRALDALLWALRIAALPTNVGYRSPALICNSLHSR